MHCTLYLYAFTVGLEKMMRSQREGKTLHMKIAQYILSPQLRWALVWFSEGRIRIT